jgi:hypothetical protein
MNTTTENKAILNMIHHENGNSIANNRPNFTKYIVLEAKVLSLNRTKKSIPIIYVGFYNKKLYGRKKKHLTIISLQKNGNHNTIFCNNFTLV